MPDQHDIFTTRQTTGPEGPMPRKIKFPKMEWRGAGPTTPAKRRMTAEVKFAVSFAALALASMLGAVWLHSGELAGTALVFLFAALGAALLADHP